MVSLVPFCRLRLVMFSASFCQKVALSQRGSPLSSHWLVCLFFCLVVAAMLRVMYCVPVLVNLGSGFCPRFPVAVICAAMFCVSFLCNCVC